MASAAIANGMIGPKNTVKRPGADEAGQAVTVKLTVAATVSPVHHPHTLRDHLKKQSCPNQFVWAECHGAYYMPAIIFSGCVLTY